MSKATKATKANRPEWFSTVPSGHRGHWTSDDQGIKLASEIGMLKPVRIVLKSGNMLDGIFTAEKNRYDESRHAIGVRLPHRKTQKWIPVEDIQEIWADKGPSLEELITEYVLAHRI